MRRGVRVTLVKPSEITAQANAYLDAHPELYDVAKERARLLRLFEKQPKRPKARIAVTPDWPNRPER